MNINRTKTAKMKLDEAVEMLRYFNKWRRANTDMPMPHPKEIGVAIDTILNYFDKKDKE